MLTVSKAINLLVPNEKSSWKPNWVPDLFGIAGYLLHITGAYHQVIEGCWPPGCDPTRTRAWEAELDEIARSWDFNGKMPAEVLVRWKTVRVTNR